jgi:hypothetical protein
VTLAVILPALAALALAGYSVHLRRQRGRRQYAVEAMVIEHEEEKAALAEEVYRLDAELCTALWEIERRQAS